MRKKWRVLPLSTLFFLLFVSGQEVYARTPPEITVVSEIMFGSQEEYKPQVLHEEGDDLYHLESWELEPVTVKPREKYVEQEILYEGVENRSMIPETRDITSDEEFSGLKVEGRYPVLRTKKVKEEWRDDFTFPVVFHSYGAEEYELGGEKVTMSQEGLEAEAYEEALLSEIGVTQEDYRVTKVVWAGSPYMDENDVLCRNAVASGKRRVRDYLVTYGGAVTFPEAEGFRCRAVYRLKEYERPPAEEKAVTVREITNVMEAETDPSWIVKKEAVVFTVSLFLILLLLLAGVWLIKKIVDKRMGKDDV